jgi:general secretion pathway protein D
VRGTAKLARRLFAAVWVGQLAACALPVQQLVLPGSGPPGDGAPSRGDRHPKTGVPLSDPPRATLEDRAYPGTGQFFGHPSQRAVLAGAAPNEGITLNLVEATAAEAARSVLGDVLGVNYSVSDKVTGSITIQTVKPVAKEALLEIFETVLRTEGAAILVDNGFYKIVPIADGLAAGAPMRAKGMNGRRIAGLGTQVVPLQHVAAAEMERILKSIAPQSTVLRADPARNLLVLSGTRSELASMLDAIGVFDVDWMRGMSFALHPVETSDVEAITQELDTVFANDKDSPTKGIVRFVPNKRLKSILVISSRPEYLEKAASWLRRIDMVGKTTEKQVHVYHVQNRPAVELAQLLQRVYASQERGRNSATASIAPRETAAMLLTPATAPEGLAGSAVDRAFPSAPLATTQPFPRAPGPPSTDESRAPPLLRPVEPANAVSPPDPGGQQQSASSAPPDDRASGISVVADEPNNALVITATPAEYKRMREILERVDVLPNQVLLEATIAEVTLNDQLKFGLRWFFERGRHQVTLAEGLPIAPVLPAFSYFLNEPNVQVALHALSSITDVNIVSSPTLMVLDTKKAVLHVGDEVPIPTQSQQSVIAPGAPIINSIAYRNTGVILGITPRISDKGRVLLEVEQEVSDVARTTTSTLDAPTIQQRRVRTTVAVGDGESLVLAGFIQDRADVGRDEVPLLGEIPLVGNVFKNKANSIRRTELLIAITPRIVNDAQQMRGITEEFRDKLNFSLRPQRRRPPDVREQVDRLLR